MQRDRLTGLWRQRPALLRKPAPLKGLADNPAYQWWRDPIGVQPDSWWGMAGRQSALDDQAALMRELGVDLFRFEVPWRELAPRMPGSRRYDQHAARDAEFGGYRWGRMEHIVATLEQAGIHPLPVLVFAPTWTMAEGRVSPTAPPADSDYVADVMHALATRYRGRIHHWELWNEPDHSHSWSGSASDYVDLVLAPGAAAVRESAPDATVLMAGLADHRNIHALLSIGAARYFDVANIHIYPATPSARHVRSAINETHVALRRAGKAGMQAWITECGIATSAPSLPSNFGGVSDEAGQARFVQSVFRSVDAGAIFVYQLRDTVIRGSDGLVVKQVFWGLTTGDMRRRKLAFDVYRDAVRRRPDPDPYRPVARTPSARPVAS